jgi:hypothetical protein
MRSMKLYTNVRSMRLYTETSFIAEKLSLIFSIFPFKLFILIKIGNAVKIITLIKHFNVNQYPSRIEI